ncbi:MAG: pilus assembly protein TadG-related protein [Halobacteriales archaeon]|nr:pilus assembly protein TadG-related protein [Halobacteriales archaeon]
MNDDKRMTSRLWRRMRSDERGGILVLTAFAMVALIALMALTIDIGKQIRATAQAQATADAAALAGGGVLLTVPGAQELARAEATLYAEKNEVMGEPVTIDPDVDVTFPGEDSIRVVVRRTSGSPDGPFSSIFGAFFGIDSLEVQRDAMARVIPTNSIPTCPVPFGIPDKWNEVGGPSDPDNPGDEYNPSEGDSYTTGYTAADLGTKIIIWDKSGAGTFNPSWYGPWHPTEENPTGGQAFKQAITGMSCGSWNTLSPLPQTVNTTTGAKVGPVAGCVDGNQQGGCGSNGTPIIQQDLNDYYAENEFSDGDDTSVCDEQYAQGGCMARGVEQIATSKRARPMPFYDPNTVLTAMESSGSNVDVTITKIGCVFFDKVEKIGGDRKITGYLVPCQASAENPSSNPNSIVRALQLVE